ncbi:hypothetical protein MIS45_04770 [Wielerella bovis]|uniref:hypothetical protein n=1 Tax=Wielerella bovis TaxID=2917790 RepID=UPI00201853E0|nr:hypothetical protein [Wielerella bovis]ULJ70140.1 hypothetical protein MIS45_04770 [Wielerella bovis]
MPYRIQDKYDELLLYSVGGTLAGWATPNTCAYFWRQAAVPYSIQHIDLIKGFQISADVIAQLKAAHWTENNFNANSG